MTRPGVAGAGAVRPSGAGGDARSDGRPRRLRWVACSLPALSAALVAVAVLVAVQAPGWCPDAQLIPKFGYPTLPLVFTLVGAPIAGRDPANAAGWLLCLVGVAPAAPPPRSAGSR